MRVHLILGLLVGVQAGLAFSAEAPVVAPPEARAEPADGERLLRPGNVVLSFGFVPEKEMDPPAWLVSAEGEYGLDAAWNKGGNKFGGHISGELEFLDAKGRVRITYEAVVTWGGGKAGEENEFSSRLQGSAILDYDEVMTLGVLAERELTVSVSRKLPDLPRRGFKKGGKEGFGKNKKFRKDKLRGKKHPGKDQPEQAERMKEGDGEF